MFKKLFALLTVAIMIFTVSCSGETAELLAFIDANSEAELDCEGKTFTFASGWYSEWYAFSDDTLPTESVEKMMTRFHSIKEKFNAEFEMVEISMDDIPQLLVTGEDIPEMFDMEADVAYDLHKSGVLVSLNQLSAVDVNDTKWGEPNFLKYGYFDGEQYGFYPWHWEFIPQFSGSLIFNAEMIATFGGTHPYELQESGSWNWESFENEMKKYTVFENEVQYYGAVLDNYGKLAKAAILSNGGQVIDGDEENGYSFSVNSPEALEALEWLKGLESAGAFIDKDFVDFSISQIAPYWIGESYYGTVFNPNDESNNNFAPAALSDYGFIQFPTGPQGDETDTGAFVYYSRRLNYLSGISDIEPDNVGKIVDYIFEPLDDSLEEGWKDLTQRLIFTENNNQQCFDNFIYMLENMGYDYSVQMGETAYDNLDTALEQIIQGKKTASEALSTVEPMVMENIGK